MRVKFGSGMAGDEVAIDAYLVAHGVHVSGPRTITVNGDLCQDVDPSGFVISKGKRLSGNHKTGK